LRCHAFEQDNEFRWTDGNTLLPTSLFDGVGAPRDVELHVRRTTQYELTGNWRHTRVSRWACAGGLVQKAGLVKLTDDDRATVLGVFMELADRLRGPDSAGDDARHLATRWRPAVCVPSMPIRN
jgi:hypothetical protein